ncbi:hypothetical protein NPIL_75321 [Nephila pilipes]|uniref:Uncharacterized protein n=1 Tax=Nephila pilipes TaxID=299642 RepID=A0A8X6MD29_NEPPI|nr:hypothetical protein NPIL_75321 [Nephila pilipes]
MNRKLWKCCGKTFSDITKYTDHFLIIHTKNADYKGTNAANRNDSTTLDKSPDRCPKQIQIPKKTTREKKCKKDVTVVDSIGKSNDSSRKIKKPSKIERKKNIALEPTIASLNRELDDSILQEKANNDGFLMAFGFEPKCH